MGLSRLKSKKAEPIYDPIRKKWVESTPEEEIRQHLVRHMIAMLGYPPLWMAIEKELAQLPSLQLKPAQEIAKRRADILVFAPHTHSPLLMIECKALPLTEAFTQQVIGYNTFVQAPFVALANGKEVLTGHYSAEKGRYCFEKGLPHFVSLKTIVQGQW
ncbi:type I restriction enzyme HsdR N-terminal domain-containing protein [Chlamydiota bacterium]